MRIATAVPLTQTVFSGGAGRVEERSCHTNWSLQETAQGAGQHAGGCTRGWYIIGHWRESASGSPNSFPPTRVVCVCCSHRSATRTASCGTTNRSRHTNVAVLTCDIGIDSNPNRRSKALKQYQRGLEVIGKAESVENRPLPSRTPCFSQCWPVVTCGTNLVRGITQYDSINKDAFC